MELYLRRNLDHKSSIWYADSKKFLYFLLKVLSIDVIIVVNPIPGGVGK